MNLRPEAAPTFPRQPIPSLPYLLGGCSRRRPTSSIHGVVHPCSRLPVGEGGPKGQVRERPPFMGAICGNGAARRSLHDRRHEAKILLGIISFTPVYGLSCLRRIRFRT